MTKKYILPAVAALLFLFFSYGFNRWLASGHSMATVWETVTRDWLLLITFTDAGAFTILCLLYLWRDATRRQLSTGRKAAWFTGTLLFGVPVFLLYLYRQEA